MPTLPSGLRTYEATEIVRRIAQNDNIEATDALFHQTDGHKHTGQPGDGPLIDTDSLASEAITTEKINGLAVTNDKLSYSAVTGDKIARNTIERIHVRSSGLSSNVAKFKKVTVSGGTVYGEPTTPYTFQDAAFVDNHLWSIPNGMALPQSITIHLDREYKAIEGMSFGTRFGADPNFLPKEFLIEASNNNSTWTPLYKHGGHDYEPFSFIPFSQVSHWRYIRLTITARKTGAFNTDISCLAVYSRYHGNTDLDQLDDQRAWGLNSRLQGLMIMPEGNVSENGNGILRLSAPLIVMNPASGTYFRVQAGSYYLGSWGYLYVDIPFQHRVSAIPYVGVWNDTGSPRGFENKNRIVLAQRQGTGPIYFHSAFQSRLYGASPDADKVDGIDFRVSGGRLEYNNGAGWNGVVNLPNYYAEINRDGRVVGISEPAGEVKADSLVPITKELFENKNLLFTRLVDDHFVGFYTTLETDKTNILDNGEDFITITARVFNWKNELHSEFNQDVVFEVDGLQQTVKAIKGVAELTLSSEEPGEFLVRTVNFDQNGDVKVVVEDASEKA